MRKWVIIAAIIFLFGAAVSTVSLERGGFARFAVFKAAAIS